MAHPHESHQWPVATLRGYVSLADQNTFNLLQRIYSQIAAKTLGLVPLILVGTIVVIPAPLVIKSLNYSLRKV